MSKIGVIIPEATTNLIYNPSFEFNTDGWNENGATLTRTIERARFGTASGMVVTDGVGLNEGIYYRIDPQTQGEFYAASVYPRGQGTLRIRVRDGTNGYEWSSDPFAVNDLKWWRIWVIGQTRGNVSNDLRLYVETAERIQSVTFYVDGAQLENKEYITTYCDGDMEESIEPHQGDVYFRWAAARHASESTRSVRYSCGGRVMTFDEIDVNLYPIRAGGLGMGDIRHGVITYSDQLRSVIKSWKPMPKTVYMDFWAREDEKYGYCPPASLARIHKARAELENIMKPDRTPYIQPTAFIYEDNGRQVEFRGFYESGLDFDGDLRFPWYSNFSVRMICPDPFVWEDDQDSISLAANKGIPNADYIVARINGEWQVPGDIGCTGSYILTIKVAPNGDVYVGGVFTSIGGVAGTARIARWDGHEWHPLATGVDDGNVRDIAFGPDGMVYVAGDYNNVGGVLHDNCSRYNPATDTWHTLGPGPGLNFFAYGVCVTDDGQVWFAGGFSNDNAGLAIHSVTRYDPDTNTFNQLSGANGLNSSALDVVPDLDGYNVYFCGGFTNYEGILVDSNLMGVVRYNRDTNDFEACGTGVDVTRGATWVRHMVMTESGKLYIIGDFTHAGYLDMEHVAMFNRQEWYPLGQEGDGMIGWASGAADVDADPSRKGWILFGGYYTGMTGSELSDGITIWNGTRFSHLDILMPPIPRAMACAFHGDDIWLAPRWTGNANASAITTVTNRGKATAKPVLEILGPARLRWLENQTTSEVVRIDCEVMAGERVMFDFREGLEKAVSRITGNILGVIFPQSDSFSLLPGDNRIAIFADGTDGDTEITLRWQIRHWGFDGVA